MAGFNASSFKYDGISADAYGLSMCYIGSPPPDVVEQLNESYQIRTLYTSRSLERTYMGKETLEPLTFSVTLFSEEDLTATRRARINKWLVGTNGYKKLEIIQDDLVTIYYLCIFTEQTTLYVGDRCVGFNLTAICDSPYQHKLPVIATDVALTEPDTITIVNASDINDYVHPLLTFTISGTQTYASIINTSDNNREFLITGVSLNEEFTVDNKNKIMTSTNASFDFNTFNLKWLRLVSGENVLSLKGLSEISISCPIYVRVGA